MFVLWAGSMRGPRVQARLVLLLLLLLSGWTRTVLGQEEEGEDTDTETPDGGDEGGDVVPTEEVTGDVGDDTTEPPVSESDSTLVTDLTSSTEDGSNSEDVGSGGSLEVGAAPPEGTTVFGTETPDEEGLDMLLIAVLAALVVLIIGGVVGGIFMYRRRNSKNKPSEVSREDPYLEGSSTEKVPMPMFEEDVPSVLELEMDELDDWMRKDDFNQQA